MQPNPQLNQHTSYISPNGGLKRWFFGLLALLVMLTGLLVASRNPEGPLYQAGLLMALAGFACIFLAIKRGFDRTMRTKL